MASDSKTTCEGLVWVCPFTVTELCWISLAAWLRLLLIPRLVSATSSLNYLATPRALLPIALEPQFAPLAPCSRFLLCELRSYLPRKSPSPSILALPADHKLACHLSRLGLPPPEGSPIPLGFENCRQSCLREAPPPILCN